MRTPAALLVVLFLFVRCTKEDPLVPVAAPVDQKEWVEFIVRPTWNGEGFNSEDIHVSGGDERVLIQQVKFFLSGITLVGAGREERLSEAELFDITEGQQVRVLKAEAGQYDSLRFGLGLPAWLNATDITTVAPESPLGAGQGMYWGWVQMYRFMIFDGRFDTDMNATGIPPFTFSIHTGRNECFRQKTIALPLEVSETTPAHITLEVDLARFFSDGPQVLRFSEGSQSHGSIEELPLAEKLSDLAIGAINAD